MTIYLQRIHRSRQRPLGTCLVLVGTQRWLVMGRKYPTARAPSWHTEALTLSLAGATLECNDDVSAEDTSVSREAPKDGLSWEGNIQLLEPPHGTLYALGHLAMSPLTLVPCLPRYCIIVRMCNNCDSPTLMLTFLIMLLTLSSMIVLARGPK